MLKPERTHPPESGVVFFAMPFGTQAAKGGDPCDFDAIYSSAFAPAIEACGMKPERLDNLYGPQGILELIWWAIQRAEIVVVDFSLRKANVIFEYALAWTLGKRVIALTQNPDDIPSDLRGLNRYIRYSQHFTDIERMKRELTLQLEALRDEPADERAPMPYHPPGLTTTVMAPAGVVSVNRDYALVQTDDGRLGFLRNADVDYGLIVSDMTSKYAVGDRLDGAFLIDAERGEARYTLLAGQTNPWTVLAPRFPVGTVHTGVVRKKIDKIGVFVGLDCAVNGLVPASSIPGPFPLVGDSVEVVVTRMDPAKRRVALRLRSVDPDVLPSEGHRVFATVTRIVPEREGKGGFLLMTLPGYPKPAILPAQHMGEDLRADLKNEQVDLGEEIYVEVAKVDKANSRVRLREIPEPIAAAA